MQCSDYKSAKFTPKLTKRASVMEKMLVVRKTENVSLDFMCIFFSVGRYCLTILLCQKIFIVTKFETNRSRIRCCTPLCEESICK